MSETDSGATRTARDYYNSEDADTFYAKVWGGEDIHVGLYESPTDPIATASHRTVLRMAKALDPQLTTEHHVLDIGSGYCGAARHLAKSSGCRVTALNLSDVENQRAREMNAQQGLNDRIEVLDGSFEDIPLSDASIDVVWSQDALLHSGNREGVLREVFRVLRPGGQLVFTDPMQSDTCPEGVLQPILERIHLSDLGCPSFYLSRAEALGVDRAKFDDLTPQLVAHYARVLEVTEEKGAEIGVSADYLSRMKAGLRHWIEGGSKGHLAWGIFCFRKAS